MQQQTGRKKNFDFEKKLCDENKKKKSLNWMKKKCEQQKKKILFEMKKGTGKICLFVWKKNYMHSEKEMVEKKKIK